MKLYLIAAVAGIITGALLATASNILNRYRNPKEKIKRIDTDEAIDIIEYEFPRGKFYHVERGIYAAIDNYNSTFKPIAEDFNNKKECIEWLRKKM